MKNCFLVAFTTLALSLTGCGSADGPTSVSNDRVVTVETAPTLMARIDAGVYNYVYSRIQPNFKVEPTTGDYEAKLVVVSFNRDISSENAVAEMKARSLRPANTSECLAYGEKLATGMKALDYRRPSYHLVCLGSTAIFSGERHVLALGDWGGEWHLSHDKWSHDWNSGHRFLAVRL